MKNISKQLPDIECELEEQIQPNDSVLLIRLSAIGDAVRLFTIRARPNGCRPRLRIGRGELAFAEIRGRSVQR